METLPTSLTTTVLPAVLDLTAAGPLVTVFLAVRGTPLMVDGSAVERLGAQCLQVLLAARDAWAADGHLFSIGSPSGVLVDTLAALGAADLAFPSIEEKLA